MDLNALAAACNTAYGSSAVAWDKGEAARCYAIALEIMQEDARQAYAEDKPALLAEALGGVVFDALALASALGIDIAMEVEWERKRQEKASK